MKIRIRMKNRMVAVGLVIAAVLALIYTVFFFNKLGISVGYYLNTLDGPMLIEDYSPMSMVPPAQNTGMFVGIERGQKLLVVHGAVDRSYPARTDAYFIIKLGSASPDNIPREVIISLVGLGWLDEAELLIE
ncbi:MAG: hypothetical protein IJY93_05740 [Clostridia bacterium]|nr:hypothetical protein [Clostridia bacterium]